MGEEACFLAVDLDRNGCRSQLSDRVAEVGTGSWGGYRLPLGVAELW